MPEAYIYDASRVAAETPALRNDPKVEEQKEGIDPLRQFETDSRKLYPELQQWHTFSEKEREKLVDKISMRPTAHRDLNYVIWRESLGGENGLPAGSPQIAFRALRRIFGIPEQKAQKKTERADTQPEVAA